MTKRSRLKASGKRRFLASACVAAPTVFGIPSEAYANLSPGDIVNGDFELPPLSGFGAYTGTAPGWEIINSVVQTESVAPFENGVAAMNNGLNTAIRQTTNHVMSDGELFALQADIFTRYDATQVSLELFAVDGGGAFAASPFATTILDNSDDHADGMWTRMFPFSGVAGPSEAGTMLGIQIRNSSGVGQANNGGQVLIDNVGVVPEPSTGGLLGLGALALFWRVFSGRKFQ